MIKDNLTRVYEYLKLDAYTSEKEVAEHTGVTALSWVFTKLRRRGYASYIGKSSDKGGKKWVRYPRNAPLVVPQQDQKNRENAPVIDFTSRPFENSLPTELRFASLVRAYKKRYGFAPVISDFPGAGREEEEMEEEEPVSFLLPEPLPTDAVPAEDVQELPDRTPEEILEDMLTLLTELSEAVKKAPVAMTIPDHLDAIHRLRDKSEP